MAVINLPQITTKTALWANRPSADSAKGEVYYFTDIGPNGSSWISNGEFWSPVNGEVVLMSSGVETSITGTTSQTALATLTIKGGMVSRVGSIDLILFMSCTNNANLKTFRVNLCNVGSITGTTYYTGPFNAILLNTFFCSIKTRDNPTLQKGFGATGGSAAGIGLSSANLITSAQNMNLDFDIVITGQLADAADSIRTYGYSIIYRG